MKETMTQLGARSSFIMLIIGMACCSLFALPNLGFAQVSSEATLAVQPQSVETGDAFAVEIAITSDNTNQVGLRNIEIAGTDEFVRQGQSTSSRVQFVNNFVQSSTSVQTVFVASEPGEYIIGPAQITTSRGEILSTETATITITQPSPIVQNDADEIPTAPTGAALTTITKPMLHDLLLFGVIIALVLVGIVIIRSFRKQPIVKESGGIQLPKTPPRENKMALPDGRTAAPEFYKQIAMAMREYQPKRTH